MTAFVDSLRDLAYGLQVPDLITWIQMSAWAAGAVALAFLVYKWRGLDIGESV
jgi:membrane protein implicated in regulation of membrane protease activity